MYSPGNLLALLAWSLALVWSHLVRALGDKTSHAA